MLKCSTSLWSADLANLATELRRVEPYSERFHLDVADGHYVHNLLFFPDLIKALRPHTALPFEVHLMVTDPISWIDACVEAGADRIIFCHDAAPDPISVVQAIKSAGKAAGVSLLISESLESAADVLVQLDTLTIVGTAMGIKGASMDRSIPDKIRFARQWVASHNASLEIEVDGGIRRETVPLIKAAGADYIVPGSLMFKEDPAVMRQWLSVC
jgi:ribulose-phosphate 3-epimerase